MSEDEEMKKFVFVILYFVVLQCGFSQSFPLPNLQGGWERIVIENFGSFDIPPTMELQGGSYLKTKKALESILKMNQSTFQIIVQQKGLNDRTSEGYSRYARVMFKTETGSRDTELIIDFDVKQFTPSEISGLNDMYKGAMQIQSASTGLKLLEWYPLKIEIINGMSCIHTSYIRQLSNNEPVIVHQYSFFNYDYDHTFILSYRQNEKDYWEKDFMTILNSLRIRKRE